MLIALSQLDLEILDLLLVSFAFFDRHVGRFRHQRSVGGHALLEFFQLVFVVQLFAFQRCDRRFFFTQYRTKFVQRSIFATGVFLARRLKKPFCSLHTNDFYINSPLQEQRYNLAGKGTVLVATTVLSSTMYLKRLVDYFSERNQIVAVLRSRFVPTAQAVHLYAQSTPSEPQAQKWFEESHERFRQQYYGASFMRMCRLLTRSPSPSPRRDDPVLDPNAAWPLDWPLNPQCRRLEISPSADGFPAAGLALPDGIAKAPFVSKALWAQMAPGQYFVTAFSESGEVLDRGRLVKAPEAATSEHG